MASEASPGLPTEVKIGTVVYAVTQDGDDWIKIEHAQQKKGYYGHSTHNEARIYLNPEGSPSVTRLTLWHEVLHCLHEAVMGGPEWRGLGEDKDAREESVIRMWEHPTLAVLRDNPALVSYLMAADGDH